MILLPLILYKQSVNIHIIHLMFLPVTSVVRECKGIFREKHLGADRKNGLKDLHRREFIIGAAPRHAVKRLVCP